jgi:Holliday junction DNA helicase RuvB
MSPEKLLRIEEVYHAACDHPVEEREAFLLTECGSDEELLRRVRDFAQVGGKGLVDKEITCHALAQLDVDTLGLDEMDKKILLTIMDRFSGGPVGASSLAVAVGEDVGTLEEVYEPYLIMEGYLKRTAQGRVVTELSYRNSG